MSNTTDDATTAGDPASVVKRSGEIGYEAVDAAEGLR